jgi:hypothetical protein
MNILLNLNDVLALCLRELGSLVDVDVLFLASLTTTHGEAGLPTSTAQRGGLREVDVRGGRLELGSGDPFQPSMLAATGGFVLTRDDVLRSNNPSVGFEPSPQACRGGRVGEDCNPQVLQPMCWL